MPEPIPGSDLLLVAVREALGLPNKPLPLIIGIDVRAGAGKTSLACWLGWQLGMPVVSLDLYVVSGTDPLVWRYADLERVLASRSKTFRPVIVEGVCLCRVLQAIDRKPDYLVWVENRGGPEPSPHDPSTSYVPKFDPISNADHTVRWGEPVQVSGWEFP